MNAEKKNDFNLKYFPNFACYWASAMGEAIMIYFILLFYGLRWVYCR